MSQPPDLEAIRTALRERIEATSLRRTAAEIGFSASGLRRIAEERGNVYRSGRQRLERWFVGRSGHKPPEADVGMDAARAALVRMGRRLIPAGIIESSEAPMEGAETPELAREREAALLGQFMSGTDSERAEGFLAIYSRFRSAVREELERAGLPAHEAEQRVGPVFGRTLADLRQVGVDGASQTLRECLLSRGVRDSERNRLWFRPAAEAGSGSPRKPRCKYRLVHQLFEIAASRRRKTIPRTDPFGT